MTIRPALPFSSSLFTARTNTRTSPKTDISWQQGWELDPRVYLHRASTFREEHFIRVRSPSARKSRRQSTSLRVQMNYWLAYVKKFKIGWSKTKSDLRSCCILMRWKRRKGSLPLSSATTSSSELLGIMLPFLDPSSLFYCNG